MCQSWSILKCSESLLIQVPPISFPKCEEIVMVGSRLPKINKDLYLFESAIRFLFLRSDKSTDLITGLWVIRKDYSIRAEFLPAALIVNLDLLLVLQNLREELTVLSECLGFLNAFDFSIVRCSYDSLEGLTSPLLLIAIFLDNLCLLLILWLIFCKCLENRCLVFSSIALLLLISFLFVLFCQLHSLDSRVLEN